MKVIFSSLVALLFAAIPAFAQTSAAGQVSVNGTGSSFAAHDAAELSLVVSTKHTSAAQANKQNREITKTLTSVFDNRKIEKKDRQTTGFAVEPVLVYDKNQEPKLTGYRTTHNINVTFRNLDEVGNFIDEVIESGAMVSGIRFKVCDTTKMMKTARGDAMADARAKAEQLAKSVGATLGEAVSISESWYHPRPRVEYRMMSTADRSESTQIASGEHQVTCDVSVVWKLVQGVQSDERGGMNRLNHKERPQEKPLFKQRIHQGEKDDK